MIVGMGLLTSLTQRRREPEVMDDPALDPRQHVAALRGLERINRWSGSVRIVWSAIAPLMTRDAAPPSRDGANPLRVLDLATGAGDVPIGLARRAAAAGRALHVDACDASPRALDYARERATQAHADVRFFTLDVLREPLPSGYDVLTSSLFLHHLADADATALLAKMAAAGPRLVVVNDLQRDWRGLLLAWLGPHVLTRCPVVHADAIRSVRAAFTREEIRSLAARAGLRAATVQRRWPRRFLLTWRP
jgi:2-polyprenyl-3-methyl-5-hydroxy-6-metoxy-1,4-benzoquinol methylase